MTNFRPIRSTQKLPEYGDCLFALQTNPVRGTRGPFGIFAQGPTPSLATPLEHDTRRHFVAETTKLTQTDISSHASQTMHVQRSISDWEYAADSLTLDQSLADKLSDLTWGTVLFGIGPILSAVCLAHRGRFVFNIDLGVSAGGGRPGKFWKFYMPNRAFWGIFVR